MLVDYNHLIFREWKDVWRKFKVLKIEWFAPTRRQPKRSVGNHLYSFNHT